MSWIVSFVLVAVFSLLPATAIAKRLYGSKELELKETAKRASKAIMLTCLILWALVVFVYGNLLVMYGHSLGWIILVMMVAPLWLGIPSMIAARMQYLKYFSSTGERN